MAEPQELSRRPDPSVRQGPLVGTRVADFGWMAVGPLATRLLSDMGAEVIKIEDRKVVDTVRMLPIYMGEPGRSYGQEGARRGPNEGGLFNNYARNKLSVTVNMRLPKGRELVERLIASCDVVTENFAPGVMERWGLTYDRLRELTPDVIFARMSGYGHSGPHANFRSYGPIVQAISGLTYISGLPGEEPSGWGFSYMDNQAAYYGSMALLTAIYHRRRTGEGTEIDLSASDVGIGLVGPTLLDVTVNGRTTVRPDFPTGNRLDSPNAAPHGVYPAQGDDRWVAIAVFDDEEWRGLTKALGDPPWTRDERFATQEQRFSHQDPLDEYLSSWTRDRPRHETMALLQSHGVPCAAVQTAQDLTEYDPQLEHRGIFFELDHPAIGKATFEDVPIHFSSLKRHYWRSAPLLGEDNEYVFKQIVGLSDDEYGDYEQAEVFS